MSLQLRLMQSTLQNVVGVANTANLSYDAHALNIPLLQQTWQINLCHQF
jgi:hypothetical protein